MRSEITPIDKLILIKKVAGVANLGLMPSPRILDRVSAYVEDLKGIDLQSAAKAIEVMRLSILPSQDICLRGMAQVDGYLKPMRQARRNELASASQRAPADRPRG